MLSLRRRPSAAATRTAFRLFGFVLPALALGALCIATAAGSAEEQPADKPRTAAQQFKNIQVLKDLPADELMPLMQRFSTALGVQCNACHVMEGVIAFEKDDKPLKKVAREMIILTNELNTKHKSMKNRATCFMCHHGKAHPQNVPGAIPAPTPAEKEAKK